MRKYVIGSGFYGKQDYWYPYNSVNKYKFFDIWYKNTLEFSSPQKIVVLSSNSEIPEKYKNENIMEWINLFINPGHYGWTLSFIETALYAYGNQCDFIYKEQDCLAFGNWVNEMYNQNKPCVFGASRHNVPKRDIEQSLVFIKYKFIPKFIEEFIKQGAADYTNESTEAETKFSRIKKKYPNKIGELSFPGGRVKPDFNEKTWYYQHLTINDIHTLKKKQLI